MEHHQVVIRPLITEKGTHQAGRHRAYPFQVNPRANKTEIKLAIQSIYNVTVIDVRTANRKGKRRRTGRTMGKTRHWKKAVVLLHEDHRIDLF